MHQKISQTPIFIGSKKGGQVIDPTVAKLLTLLWPNCGQVIDPYFGQIVAKLLTLQHQHIYIYIFCFFEEEEEEVGFDQRLTHSFLRSRPNFQPISGHTDRNLPREASTLILRSDLVLQDRI